MGGLLRVWTHLCKSARVVLFIRNPNQTFRQIAIVTVRSMGLRGRMEVVARGTTVSVGLGLSLLRVPVVGMKRGTGIVTRFVNISLLMRDKAWAL